MTDTPDATGTENSTGNVFLAVDLIRAMGLVFSNTFLYGVAHSVTKKSVGDCFTVLTKALSSWGEISFNIKDDDLIVNNIHVEQKNPLMRMFVTHLTELSVDNFDIKGQMDDERFRAFIELMNAKPHEIEQLGGFAAGIEVCGLQENIACRKIVYQQVAEDELVVSKDDVDGEGGAGGANVEGILAFLKGEPAAGTDDALNRMEDIASDADKLGDLILRAAEVRRDSVEMEGGENFGDLVVGCIRRVCDGLSDRPAAKTKKGKKNLSKSLMLLEKDLLDKMREMSDGVVEEDVECLSTAVSDMREDLKIDELASDYMKKRAAIDANEKSILRFMKSKGEDGLEQSDLKERLEEGGLTPQGWQELMVRSGAEGAGKGGEGEGEGEGEGGGDGIGFGDGTGGMAAVGRLAGLLTHMEEAISQAKEMSGKDATQGVQGVLSEVDQQLREAVTTAEDKIQDVIDDAKADAVAAAETKEGEEPAPQRLSRPRLLAFFAELGQELCQPLAVVTCSIDMLRSGSLGEITEQQDGMLDLAATGNERLKTLVDKMLEISGVPTTMSPDEEVQSSLYE